MRIIHHKNRKNCERYKSVQLWKVLIITTLKKRNLSNQKKKTVSNYFVWLTNVITLENLGLSFVLTTVQPTPLVCENYM